MTRDMRQRRTYWSVRAPDAGALLARVEQLGELPERVYMTGASVGDLDGVGGFAFGAPLPAGWAHGAHYLDSSSPVFRFVRDDGARVEVLRAAAWYGEGAYGPRDARDAHQLVGELLRAEFPGSVLLPTPATTGRELVARSLPFDYRAPVLNMADQDLIRATSGQGRTTHDDELRARAAAIPELAHVAVFDCRFAYAALCWQLPAGAPTRVLGTDAHAVDVMARARWRVRATVPRDWATWCACGAPGHAGIGLLGWRAAGDPEWHYPSEPGHAFETWCDGAELKVAIDHGWGVDVLDGLVWAADKSRPLDVWARHLVAARAACDGRADVEPEVRAMARAAIRMVLLATIGALLGAPRTVTRALPRARADEIPRDAPWERVGDLAIWSERAGQAWPAMARPEWAACIYGRQRARLLDAPTARGGVRAGALHVPAEHVLAMRTDALYLACAPPAWPDNGRPGRFTLRSDVAGPVPAPRSTEELRRLVGAI